MRLFLWSNCSRTTHVHNSFRWFHWKDMIDRISTSLMKRQIHLIILLVKSICYIINRFKIECKTNPKIEISFHLIEYFAFYLGIENVSSFAQELVVNTTYSGSYAHETRQCAQFQSSVQGQYQPKISWFIQENVWWYIYFSWSMFLQFACIL